MDEGFEDHFIIELPADNSHLSFEKEKRKRPTEELRDLTLPSELELIKIQEGGGNPISTANTQRQLNKDELRTLSGGNWLCGGVINTYLEEISSGRNDTAIMSSYFCESLAARGIKTTITTRKRTIRRLKKAKIIIVPVFQNTRRHWTLATISENQINFYDSLNMSIPKIVETLAEFMFQTDIVTNDYIINMVPGIPRQSNFTDCGIFVIQYARCIIQRKVMDFDQSEIDFLRADVGQALLRKLDKTSKYRDLKDCTKGPSDEDILATSPASRIPNDYVFTFDQETPRDDMNEITKEAKNLPQQMKDMMIKRQAVIPQQEEGLEETNDVTSDTCIPTTTEKKLEAEPTINNPSSPQKTDLEETNDVTCLTKIMEKKLEVKPNITSYKPVFRHYQHDPELTKQLKKGIEPYLDIDEKGKLFTRNTADNFKNSLIFLEALDMLAPDDIEKGWQRLTSEIAIDVTFALKWIRKIGEKYSKLNPTTFMVGKKSNLSRMIKIVNTIHPHLKVTDPHSNPKPYFYKYYGRYTPY